MILNIVGKLYLYPIKEKKRAKYKIYQSKNAVGGWFVGRVRKVEKSIKQISLRKKGRKNENENQLKII